METTTELAGGGASDRIRWVDGFLAQSNAYLREFKSKALLQGGSGSSTLLNFGLATIRGYANAQVTGFEEQLDDDFLDPAVPSGPERNEPRAMRHFEYRREQVQALKGELETAFIPLRARMDKILSSRTGGLDGTAKLALKKATLFSGPRPKRKRIAGGRAEKTLITAVRAQSANDGSSRLLDGPTLGVRSHEKAETGRTEEDDAIQELLADRHHSTIEESGSKQQRGRKTRPYREAAWWISYSFGTLLFILHSVLAFSVLVQHKGPDKPTSVTTHVEPVAEQQVLDIGSTTGHASSSGWKFFVVYAIMVCMTLLVVFERLRQLLWNGSPPAPEVQVKQHYLERVLHISMMGMIILGCGWHIVFSPDQLTAIHECSLELVCSIAVTLMSHAFSVIIHHESSTTATVADR
jgi:hypothetical protein